MRGAGEIAGDTIQPGNIYEVAKLTLPPEEIGSHFSDLYIRVTPQSRKLIDRLPKDEFGRLPALLSTFKNQADGHMWYDLPFCYTPYFAEGRK